FGVVIDPADTYKYAYRRISGENRWGLLIPISDPLAAQTAISPETIRGQALIVSEREPVVKMLTDWAGHAFNPNQVVARYNLIYNAGLLAQLGSGYIVGLSHLIGHDEMQLKFIPFSPTLTTKMALIWTKNVPMSGAAQKFLEIFNQLIETV
ncbi:MAG: LysR family transcriptional regulator substrate-binding protein, partial [Lacticaseibacillus paracasei]